LEDIPQDWGRSVVTIGSYDGVHRGHQLIIRHAVNRARELGVPAVVVTFDPHPSEVVRPGSHPPLLAPHHRRAELMAGLGVDAVLILPFTTEFSKLSPADFVVKVLVDKLHAKAVVEGPNFRFGHKAAGHVEFLATQGKTYDFEVEVVDLYVTGEAGGGEPFSSTLTRRLVAEGDVEGAAEILGRPHRVEGVVVRGAQRGREMGFPTANVETLPHTAIPADGVYAGWLHAQGEAMPAAISVGTNPQFDGTERTVEAYAIDRVGLDLYGLHVAVDFLAFARRTAGADGRGRQALPGAGGGGRAVRLASSARPAYSLCALVRVEGVEDEGEAEGELVGVVVAGLEDVLGGQFGEVGVGVGGHVAQDGARDLVPLRRASERQAQLLEHEPVQVAVEQRDGVRGHGDGESSGAQRSDDRVVMAQGRGAGLRAGVHEADGPGVAQEDGTGGVRAVAQGTLPVRGARR
jgi:riboflavin kinase/FMN adenylyltransferase